jgi:hypothetical protein
VIMLGNSRNLETSQTTQELKLILIDTSLFISFSSL